MAGREDIVRPPYKFTVDMTGQCSACMEVFFGEGAFDAHWRGDGEGRHCIDPADPPLTRAGVPEEWWLDGRQRWHRGARMTDEARARLLASSARAKSSQNGLVGISGGVGQSEGSQTAGGDVA
jgi:hypothetical protein